MAFCLLSNSNPLSTAGTFPSFTRKISSCPEVTAKAKCPPKKRPVNEELLRQQGLEDYPAVLLLNADNSKGRCILEAVFQFGLHRVSCEEELRDSRQGNGTIKSHVFWWLWKMQ